MDCKQNIPVFFTPNEWNAMNEYERRRYENVRRNFEALKEIGIIPKVSGQNEKIKKELSDPKTVIKSNGQKEVFEARVKLFAVPKCQKQAEKSLKRVTVQSAKKESDIIPCFQKTKGKSNMESVRGTSPKVFSQKILKRASFAIKLFQREKECETSDKVSIHKISKKVNESRYPKRNIKKKCYKEEELSSEDEFLHCDDCNQLYKGACPVHGPMLHVLDTKVPKGVPDRAIRTLPDFLSISFSSIPKAGLGVWTEKPLHPGMVFGPYNGHVTMKRVDAKRSGYAWQIWQDGRAHHYVEGDDPSDSNWLRFVNCANVEDRQNLVAFQYQKQVFYKVYKPVLAFTELLVWYGNGYAEDLGIDLKEEKETLPPKEVEGNECDICGALFSSLEKLEGHKRRHPHLQSDLRHKCTECSYSTKNTEDLRCHLLTHTGERPHPCPHCEKRFRMRHHLRRHLLLHTGEKPFRCSTCGMNFNLSFNLRTHQLIHSGKRHHLCSTCGKSFQTASVLKLHERTHTHQKPYKCPHCQHRSNILSNIRTHIVRVHTREFRHVCPYCGKGYVWPHGMSKHIKVKHRSETEVSPI